MVLELKSLKAEVAEALKADEWTVESLAVATVKELVIYRGVGRIGAAKIIAEAAEMLNERGLATSDTLAMENYYQTSSSAKVLKDWEDNGLPIRAVALTTARALAALKGIDEALAIRLISEGQNIVNRRGLYQSRVAVLGDGPSRQTNAAFDEKWLSGEVEPPPMSIRVKRNFDEAQRGYRAANG